MKQTAFTEAWKQYEPLLEAIVELFHPFVEVAVHDLEKGKLAAIYHNISQRKVGDPSPLNELKVPTGSFPNHFAPYLKQNFDGRPLKCTSITIRNKTRKPIGLICINVDVSTFQEAELLLNSFLRIKKEAENPIEIFGSGCEAQVDIVIQQYLDKKQLSLKHLKRDEKRELVQELYRKGIFNFKNAAPVIAKKLKTSRATIYNYIGLFTK